MSEDRLNIVLPFYNPPSGWEDKIVHSLNELEKELKGINFRVILVNDGSTLFNYNVEGILSRFGFLTYYSYPVNQGKGYAVRYGITRSEADFYIYTDIDFPFGYRVIYETYQLLKSSNANIIIGTRDSTYLNLLPVKRRIISYLVKKLNYLITGLRIKDTQAGLKGLDNKARKVLSGTKINSFIFELEFLKASLKKGLTFDTIGVSIRPGINFTDFSFKIIVRETNNFLKLIFRDGEPGITDF